MQTRQNSGRLRGESGRVGEKRENRGEPGRSGETRGGGRGEVRGGVRGSDGEVDGVHMTSKAWKIIHETSARRFINSHSIFFLNNLRAYEARRSERTGHFI